MSAAAATIMMYVHCPGTPGSDKNCAKKGHQTFSMLPFYFTLIRQLLSKKENICADHHRKSHALQDAKKYFFLYTIRKMRSTAFQSCITLGGLHWAEMDQKNDFLNKNALKTAFFGRHNPGLTDFRGGWDLIFF